jgi:signal transduction histidine kinase
LRRLAGAVAHEVGNPLVGIRTFAQMLPSRFDDPEFRAQFAERVEADTRRIEAVVETLARLGSLPVPARDPVDVSALIARLLQLQASRIQERRLVVLEELDREQPHALGDADQLRFALGMLLEETLSWLPENGDLYVATRHHADAGGAGRFRVLLRSRGAGGGLPDFGLRLAENTLAVAAVEAVVRAHGGSFTVEPGEPGETLVLIELPAP